METIKEQPIPMSTALGVLIVLILLSLFILLGLLPSIPKREEAAKRSTTHVIIKRIKCQGKLLEVPEIQTIEKKNYIYNAGFPTLGTDYEIIENNER